jgi:hypothetical protein
VGESESSTIDSCCTWNAQEAHDETREHETSKPCIHHAYCQNTKERHLKDSTYKFVSVILRFADVNQNVTSKNGNEMCAPAI